MAAFTIDALIKTTAAMGGKSPGNDRLADRRNSSAMPWSPRKKNVPKNVDDLSTPRHPVSSRRTVE